MGLSVKVTCDKNKTAAPVVGAAVCLSLGRGVEPVKNSPVEPAQTVPGSAVQRSGLRQTGTVLQVPEVPGKGFVQSVAGGAAGELRELPAEALEHGFCQ